MSTGRNTPRGQRRSAWKMGMALWTPMARASYEHAETTPRPPRSPPTITGRPRSSGRRACSTEAKKASMSRCRIARCDTNICSYLTPRGTDGQSSREGGAAQGRLHVQRRQTASALHGKVEPWDVAATEYSTDVLGHREGLAARQDLRLAVVESVGIGRRREVHVEYGQPLRDGLADAHAPAAVAHDDRVAAAETRRLARDLGHDVVGLGEEGELTLGHP